MDYKNYRSTWAKEEEGAEQPVIKIPAANMRWDLSWGASATALTIEPEFYARSPFQVPKNGAISDDLQLAPVGCVNGHNVQADAAFTALLDVDPNIPVSPVFVRDLCGRLIHIGLGPERKTFENWSNYGADQQIQKGEEIEYPNAIYPFITFPENCHVVPEELEGYDLIENVFFTKFRTLDMTISEDDALSPSGQPDIVNLGRYANANLYPYKVRLDTFYIDGYKVPQTEMVFARPDVQPHQARHAVEALQRAWENRPKSASYDAFIEGLDDDIERFFDEGCTLIPTFEACNGVHKVSPDFELVDYWAGRAVEGLHTIVEVRNDPAPAGTIIGVLKPGYVTAWDVEPAEVIVSSGSEYTSENDDDPEPLFPNLHLPHQRTVGIWGRTWIPTHPGHFEAPAIWGWDTRSGHFLQISGPLWDPLHYYYACTDIVLKAFEDPMPENRWLVNVPEEMDNRFYPVVAMNGFDTLDIDEKEVRAMALIQPYSAAKRVYPESAFAPVGYHPLPPQFEYELDPYWMPELHPLNRGLDPCPEEIEPLWAPVITSAVQPQEYIKTVKAPEEATWMLDMEDLMPSQMDPVMDYPFLLRYVEADLSEEEIMTMSSGLFLAEMPESYLNDPPQKLWSDVDDLEPLESLGLGVYDAVWGMREEALKLMRIRHQLYRQNPGLYAFAWWICVDAAYMENFFKEWVGKQDQEELEKEAANVKMPLGAQLMPMSDGLVEDAHTTVDVENLLKKEEIKE